MRWLQVKKKIIILKCHLLLFYTTTLDHFSIELVQQEVNFIWQLLITSSVVGQRRSSKHFPKPKLHQERCNGLVWWSAACLIHHSLLNRGKTISSEKYAHQISDMNQKLESIDQKKGLNSSYEHPITYHIASALIVEQIGLWSFVSSTIFSWPFPSQLPLHASGLRFAGIMLPQPAGGRKCFPRVQWTPKHGFLCYRNKQTYFSLAKMCWL